MFEIVMYNFGRAWFLKGYDFGDGFPFGFVESALLVIDGIRDGLVDLDEFFETVDVFKVAGGWEAVVGKSGPFSKYGKEMMTFLLHDTK